MYKRRPRKRGTYLPPDLLQQARENLGHSDPIKVADELFNAAMRALAIVPYDHPQQWALLTGHYIKLAALYEAIKDRETGDGFKSPKLLSEMVSEHVPGKELTPFIGPRP